MGDEWSHQDNGSSVRDRKFHSFLEGEGEGCGAADDGGEGFGLGERGFGFVVGIGGDECIGTKVVTGRTVDVEGEIAIGVGGGVEEFIEGWEVVDGDEDVGARVTGGVEYFTAQAHVGFELDQNVGHVGGNSDGDEAEGDGVFVAWVGEGGGGGDPATVAIAVEMEGLGAGHERRPLRETLCIGFLEGVISIVGSAGKMISEEDGRVGDGFVGEGINGLDFQMDPGCEGEGLCEGLAGTDVDIFEGGRIEFGWRRWRRNSQVPGVRGSSTWPLESAMTVVWKSATTSSQEISLMEVRAVKVAPAAGE